MHIQCFIYDSKSYLTYVSVWPRVYLFDWKHILYFILILFFFNIELSTFNINFNQSKTLCYESYCTIHCSCVVSLDYLNGQRKTIYHKQGVISCYPQTHLTKRRVEHQQKNTLYNPFSKTAQNKVEPRQPQSKEGTIFKKQQKTMRYVIALNLCRDWMSTCHEKKSQHIFDMPSFFIEKLN